MLSKLTSAVWSTSSLPSQNQRYDVYVNWVEDSNNASNATYTIDQAKGKDKTVTKNQQTGGGQWQLLKPMGSDLKPMGSDSIDFN
ncbi:MAG: hypothetical protein ACKE9I_08575 [Methylophagaceae bacterium]